jgi:hypothetical protein
MKLDPGMHIGLHLVFFGKSGVTFLPHTCLEGYRTLSLFRISFVTLYKTVPTLESTTNGQQMSMNEKQATCGMRG